MDRARVMKELTEVAKDTASGVTVRTMGDSLSHMEGTIEGPKDTVYENGVFKLDIVLTESYPFEPPKVKFITRVSAATLPRDGRRARRTAPLTRAPHQRNTNKQVYHPNVSSQTGTICLDILKEQWSPALTIKTCLLSIQALLSSPEPNDPQDAVVAKQYLESRALFDQTARQWCETYAKPGGGGSAVSPAVAKLTEMGFDAAAAENALAQCGGDEQQALEILLAG